LAEAVLTLIERLVVIAIIAILAALPPPVLSKARDSNGSMSFMPMATSPTFTPAP